MISSMYFKTYYLYDKKTDKLIIATIDKDRVDHIAKMYSQKGIKTYITEE